MSSCRATNAKHGVEVSGDGYESDCAACGGHLICAIGTDGGEMYPYHREDGTCGCARKPHTCDLDADERAELIVEHTGARALLDKAKMADDERRATVAFLLDRAGQYDNASGYVAFVGNLIDDLVEGRHVENMRAGEYDDLAKRLDRIFSERNGR